jgi:hypothetical protein
MKTFTYAGTALHKKTGKLIFRVTNRAYYERVLEREGHREVAFQMLPRPMTKSEAEAYIGTPSSAPVVAETPVVAPAAVTITETDARTAEEVAAVRAKNLDTIRKVGKRYDQMAKRLAEIEDAA